MELMLQCLHRPSVEKWQVLDVTPLVELGLFLIAQTADLTADG